MKKRAFSLIEVVISLGLITLLVSSLFFWYRHLSSQRVELHKMKALVIEERRLIQRLERVVPKVRAPLVHHANSQSFAFLFDRGVYPEPLLAGLVLGHLYLDEKNQTLCLGIWPHPDRETSPFQTLPLMQNVTHLAFDFYFPPDPHALIVDPEQVGHPRPREGWQSTWLADYEQTPAMIKMVVTREKLEPFEYIFDLRMSIIYPEEKLA